MNPAGAERTALWDGPESLVPAQMPSLLEKPNKEGGAGEVGKLHLDLLTVQLMAWL